MGTSVSQGSPRTVPWAAVSAAYKASNVSIERVVAEIWRAARSEEHSNWESFLGAPAVTICLRNSVNSSTAAEALHAASRQISQERVSSLAADIAKRAIVKCFSHPDRVSGFAQELFVETTNYLVSRDLSGSVSQAARNTSVSQAIAFKEEISRHVLSAVREAGRPSIEPDAWRTFLRRVVSRLSR
jgi:hypothetical protein